MPTMKRDKYSGGITFDLSPEESDIKVMKATLEAMTKELEEKLKSIDTIIENNKSIQTE